MPRCNAGSTIGLRTRRANRVTPLTTHDALLALDPYVLDPTMRSLTRNGDEVLVGKRHSPLPPVFTSRPGEVIPSDRLPDQACRSVVEIANSLDQAIATLRRTLTLAVGMNCHLSAQTHVSSVPDVRLVNL